VAETRGNPLALIELRGGCRRGSWRAASGLPGTVPLSGRIEESFGRQLDALPPPTQCCWRWRRRTRPATRAGVGGRPGGWGSVCPRRRRRREAGLADFGATGALPASAAALGGLPVRVGGGPAGHPRGPGRGDRSGRRPGPPRLAPCPGGDRPGRRGRSRRSSSTRRGRAQARGGLAAAAAFAERSALLTTDPARRAERTLTRGPPQPGGRRFRRGGRACWRRRGIRFPGRSTSCRAPGSTCCAGSSSSPRAWAARRRRCCSRRPPGSSRSTFPSPARPT